MDRPFSFKEECGAAVACNGSCRGDARSAGWPCRYIGSSCRDNHERIGHSNIEIVGTYHSMRFGLRIGIRSSRFERVS